MESRNSCLYSIIIQAPIFKNLDHESINYLVGRASQKTYSKESYVFSANQEATHIYVVASGEVKCGYYRDDRFIVTKIHQPHMGIGLLSIFNGKYLADAVVTKKNTMLVAIDKFCILKLYQGQSSFAMDYIQNISVQIQYIHQALRRNASKLTMERLLFYLFRFCEPKKLHELKLN